MYVHGDNIHQKETSDKKYSDALSKKYLSEIREKYNIWKEANEKLIGPGINSNKKDKDIIKVRVKLLNEYKDFLDQQVYAEHFDSRSNLHSSVLEEFMYYLFKDLVAEFSKDALIGKCHAFKDIFFRADNYKQMLKEANAKVEKKDHDFVIGTQMEAYISCTGQEKTSKPIKFDIPAVAIECKTYFDKTMLEGSSTAAEQLKYHNPNAIYILAAERLKLSEDVNLRKYKIDQIYIFRKQKNTDREYRYAEGYVNNPIYPDVVENLFNYVRSYLTTDWKGSTAAGIKRGYLL